MSAGSMRAKNNKLERQTAAFARAAPKNLGRKRRPSMDPRERSWAHAYLKHVAAVKGLPYAGARESMQDLGRYFGIEIPVEKAGAGRSKVAIGLANAIQAQTGIKLPAQQ